MRGSALVTTLAVVVFACLLSTIEKGAPSCALASPFPEPYPGTSGSKKGPRPPVTLGNRMPGFPNRNKLPANVRDLSKRQKILVQQQLRNPMKYQSTGK
uniref:Secreted protein n=1 Tax=Rhipicephalus zambeziensis TaxID=60191 RepID=A0A224Y8S5_9ACAR